MQGTNNELQKLKNLRDNEKKSLAMYVEQQDRATKEHEQRLIQVTENLRRSRESIETWNKLINLLEENTRALKEIENAS